MLQRLEVAQVVAQGLLELGQREKEPIMGGPPPQHPPEALDDLELWTIAGQPYRTLERVMHFRRMLLHWGYGTESLPQRCE